MAKISRIRSLGSLFDELWSTFVSFDHKILRTSRLSFQNVASLSTSWRTVEKDKSLPPTRFLSSLILLFFVTLHVSGFELVQIRIDQPFVITDVEFELVADWNGEVAVVCLVEGQCKSNGALHIIVLAKNVTQASGTQLIKSSVTTSDFTAETITSWNDTIRWMTSDPTAVNGIVSSLTLPLLLVSSMALCFACLLFAGGVMRDASNAYGFAVYLHSCLLQLLLIVLVFRILMGIEGYGLLICALVFAVFIALASIAIWRICEGSYLNRTLRFSAVLVTYAVLLMSTYAAYAELTGIGSS